MRLIGKIFGVFLDAYWRFLAQDGWAIASYIGLSALTSMFPFLIFVTALAGFFGTQDLAEEAARLIFAVWPREVAGPIAGEAQSVLTAPRGGLLTIGAALALYFASGAIEPHGRGLNRAWRRTQTRPVAVRLESIGFVVVAAFGLLALAFLVVLGPLIWDTVVRYVPELAPLGFLVTFIRLGAAVVLMAITLFLAHILLLRTPVDRSRPGRRLDLHRLRRFWRRLRRLSLRIRPQLCLDLCGPRLGDDRARLSLFHGGDFHLWRCSECGNHASKGEERVPSPEGDPCEIANLMTGRGESLLPRLDHVLERAQARRRRVDQHGHVARRVLVPPHLGMRRRDLVPGKDFRHAGVDAAVEDELSALPRPVSMGEMQSLDGVLAGHPDEARVEGRICSSSPAQKTTMPPRLTTKQDRKGLLAWMFEDDVDVLLARYVPDRFAELARLRHERGVFVGVDLGQLAPALESLAVDHAPGPERQDIVALALVRDDADRVGAGRRAELNAEHAEPA